jgi:hypothetical protein
MARVIKGVNVSKAGNSIKGWAKVYYHRAARRANKVSKNGKE